MKTEASSDDVSMDLAPPYSEKSGVFQTPENCQIMNVDSFFGAESDEVSVLRPITCLILTTATLQVERILRIAKNNPGEARLACKLVPDAAYADSNIAGDLIQKYNAEAALYSKMRDYADSCAMEATHSYHHTERRIAFLRNAFRDKMGDIVLTPQRPSASWPGFNKHPTVAKLDCKVKMSEDEWEATNQRII